MLEKIKYVNSRGESIVFGEAGIYVNENDLRDWEWDFNTTYGRIRGLQRKRNKRLLPVQIWADNEFNGVKIKNRLHDVTEVDVVAGTPGRLYVGDWYLPCFVVKSVKGDYLISKRMLDVTLTLAVNSGPWYCDEVVNFADQGSSLSNAYVGMALVGFAKVGDTGDSGAASTSGGSYPYGYPGAYSFSTYNDYVVNDCAADATWKLTVHGPAANPAVTIGDTVHRLNYRIPAGAYVEIDSRERTILLHKDGEVVNLFRYRDKVDDIFAAVPNGSHFISWNGDYIFSFVLYKERSEPAWT